MELTRDFKKLNKNDAGLAGGKGASLGEMTQAGIPVPPGFVVLAESFEQFIKETDLVQEIDAILHKVNHKEIHTVEAASETIRGLILSRDMPKSIAEDISKQFKELNTKYVAVRSSATAEDGMDHAWAGQLESYLNTQEDDVLTKVKLCWSSLFTPRAIFYRFEKGLHSTKISVAVVIQKMVESEVSGIAFSVHPVTEDYNQLIIEAGFGLGEAIVSGSVTPDSYVVEKQPRNILDINVSTQERALNRSEKSSKEHGNNEWVTIPEPKASSQVLTEAQILELSEIILKIENHYEFPCDIEWAYEAGKFYIVQSRPITTLTNKGLNKSGLLVNKEKDTVEIDTKSYYLNFKAKGPGLYFAELGTTAYDPNGVINIVKNGLLYSFYTKEAEKDNAEFSKKKDFFDIVSSAKLEIEELHKKYQNFELPKKLLIHTEFDEIHKDLLKGCALYRYVNNSYLDTFLTTGTKDQVSKIGEYKNEMQKCLFDLLFSDQCIYKKVLRNISNYAQISYDDIEHYYYTELIELITQNKKLDSSVITFRKQSSAIRKDKDGKLEFISSEKADALFDALYGQSDTQNILNGMTGHTIGKVVTGKVKIIHTDYKNPENVKKEMAEMEEGQVLVSQITAPELMPAIRKASAIVTDIGGMLSHAAIISRELNIPCIIGTKNGSEVLKDGDMVEVDADKGIVKILMPVDILEKLRSMKWEKWLERPFNAFVLSIFEDSVRPESFAKIGLSGVELKAQLFQKSIMYLHNASLEAMDAQVEEYLKTHSMFDITENLAKYKQDSENRILDAINANIPVEEKFNVVYETLKHCCTFIWLAHGIESFYNRKLKEMVPKYIKTDIEKFIGDASFPKKKNAHVYLEEMIRKGAPVGEILEKYGWIKIRDGFSDGYTIEDIEKMRASLPEVKAHVDVEIPKELKDLFNQIQELVFFRTARTDVFYELFYKSRPILRDMAEKHNIVFNDMRYYRAKPFITGEAKRYVPNFSFAYLDGKVIFQDDPILPEDTLTEGQEIRGTIAYKGKVTGKVKIVKTVAEIDKVEVGDILVTQMTFPNFIPAMIKAIAFVTDEGGITCHAAIVAREMRKPCIIGTKVATRILKDGDMVEVDADKGIVKILK